MAADESTCVYCLREAIPRSEEHIFPRFLGGKATIITCRTCNNAFGHGFEGTVSNHFGPIQLHIRSFGLPVKTAPAIWRAAIELDGKKYDLEPSLSGLKPVLNKPTFCKNEDGTISTATFRTMEEAERMRDSLLKRGKAKRVEIKMEPPTPAFRGPLPFTFSFTPEVRQLALKMSVAASTKIPNLDYQCLPSLSDGIAGLAIQRTLIAFNEFSGLDEFRPPLAHTIYLEHLDHALNAWVLFFGIFPVFCHLAVLEGPPFGFLATLDLKDEEHFMMIDPVGIQPPFPEFPQGYVAAWGKYWMEKLRKEAVSCGAKFPPEWQGEKTSIS